MLNQETEIPKSNNNDNKNKQIEAPIVLGSSNDLLLHNACLHCCHLLETDSDNRGC